MREEGVLERVAYWIGQLIGEGRLLERVAY